MDFDQIMAELQKDEGTGPPGKSFQLYLDSRGYQTIGYGFCVDPRLHCTIPKPVADFWLEFLVQQKCDELTTRVDWPWFASIGSARQQLLVCLDYNEGLGDLLDFHLMLNDLAAGDYDGAADQLQDSAWFREVGVRGPKYVQIMKTGVWPDVVSSIPPSGGSSGGPGDSLVQAKPDEAGGDSPAGDQSGGGEGAGGG